jgi:glutathione S-transferase
MSAPFRVFGSELSPYSVKVRSYLRFKKLPNEWIVRNASNMAEFSARAKLPLIPLVITPDDRALQDSTPILETLEAEHPEPSIHPSDPALAFLSALLEEYGDEWGNKPMFHYRWWYEPDRRSAAERLATSNAPDATREAQEQLTQGLMQRMHGRLGFVGSSAETKDVIEDSFREQIGLLEAHLRRRRYLLGGRPAIGDFGIWPQLYECWTDPTAGREIRERAPAVAEWIERMLDPKVEGEFETLASLLPTLEPLLAREVCGRFLPRSDANAKALAAGQAEMSAVLHGRPFSQQVQKYHARSLAALRARYAAVSDKRALDPVLERTGCKRWLEA